MRNRMSVLNRDTLSGMVCAIGVTMASAAPVHAQVEYIARDVSTPNPQGFFSAPLAECKVDNVTVFDKGIPEGGYVKLLTTNVRIDSAASVTGYCDWMLDHTLFWPQRRDLSHIGINYFSPSQSQSYTSVVGWGNPTPQTLDTRVASTTTGPISTWFNEVGTWTYEWYSVSFATQCGIPQYSATVQKALNVVACIPEWKYDSRNSIPHFPVDETPITVAYPSSLGDAVEAAIGSWNSKLSQWGLGSLQFTLLPGGGCAVINSHCIQIQSATCPDIPDACGCRFSNSLNGSYTTRSIVQLKPGYTEWSLDAQAWTLAHEVGHLLGLGEQDQTVEGACDGSTTVMSEPVTCGTIPTGQAIAATDSDAIPVSKTVYQGGPTKVCK